MIIRNLLAAAVAAGIVFAGTTAFAGKDTVPNTTTPLPASVGAAIASLLNSGDGGTITLTTGQQIFVSTTGTLVTSSSSSITAQTVFDAGDVVYSGTSPVIAGFIAQYIADSDGELTDGSVAALTQ